MGRGWGRGVTVRTYILRRVVHMVPVLLGVVTVVFLSLRLIPIAVGLPVGILAAIRRGTVIEFLMMLGSLIGVAMPVFWIGLMLIYWLGAQAGLFPLSGVTSTTISIPPRTYFYTVDSLLEG